MLVAQSALMPPPLGFLHDEKGAIRPVFGVASAFVVEPPNAEGVISAAFSSRYGWLKTKEHLLLTDAQGKLLRYWRATAGPAVFAFSADGSRALACLTGTGELVLWPSASGEVEHDPSPGMDRRHRQPSAPSLAAPRLPLDQIAGEIFAAGVLSGARVSLLVRRETGLWLARVWLPSGSIERQIPLAGVAEPVLLLRDGGLVFAAGEELVVRSAGGFERRLAAGGPVVALGAMGDEWIQVTIGTGPTLRLALRTAGKNPQLFRLPETGR
jgi:hypothetical protein